MSSGATSPPTMESSFSEHASRFMETTCLRTDVSRETLPFQLSVVQKKHFIEHGYVRIKGAVAPAAVDAALRLFNARMGRGISDEEIAHSPAGGFFKEVTHHRPFADILPGPVALGLAESIIGADKIGQVDGAQVALRFPRVKDEMRRLGAHLDGLHTPDNGVPAGELHGFTCLVGVFLSDVSEPDRGNFTVWPAGHHAVADWFAHHDYQELEDCLPPILNKLAPPRQIIAHPGDALIAHYLLPHGIAPNYGPNIRYACFHRLKHVDYQSQKFDALTDPWLHYEGL